ncbi:hypothetical protein V1512DRAFT_261230 [Lipomyces arxii]|uniref:uncharacterized protein n=1 Tax=Lipomyces arxii TaxID=56418 RepID=UPI0034CF690B
MDPTINALQDVEESLQSAHGMSGSSAGPNGELGSKRFEIAIQKSNIQGQRYKDLETIAKVLHQFHNEKIEVQLQSGNRLVISPKDLEYFDNGFQAFEDFLLRIPDNVPQQMIVRTGLRTRPSLIQDYGSSDEDGNPVKPESIGSSRGRRATSSNDNADSDLETGFSRRPFEIVSADSDVNDSEDEISDEMLSDDVPLANRGKKRKKPRKSRTRSRPHPQGDNSSSEDVPIGRLSTLRNDRRVNYNERRASTITVPLINSDSETETAAKPRNSRLSEGLTRLKNERLERIRLRESSADARSGTSSGFVSDRDSESEHGRKRSRLSAGSNGLSVWAKRKFPTGEPGSLFSRRHMNECAHCHQNATTGVKGTLVPCQSCSASYHVDCARGSHSKPSFVLVTPHLCVLQCKFCMGQKPGGADGISGQMCYVCGENGLNTKPFESYKPPVMVSPIPALPGFPSQPAKISEPLSSFEAVSEATENEPEEEKITDPHMFDGERVMFRCQICHRAAHYNHLRPKPGQVGENIEVQFADFQCTLCTSYTLPVENILAWRSTDAFQNGTDSALPLISFDSVPVERREYLVKFKGQSYFHATWVEGSWLLSVCPVAMSRTFHRKNSYAVATTEEAIPEDYYRIESILEVIYNGNKKRSQMKFKSETDEMNSIDEVERVYAKWRGLTLGELFWERPPSKSEKERYEDYKLAFKDYARAFYIHLPGRDVEARMSQARKTPFKRLEYKRQPDFLSGGTLLDYQLDGVNWMYFKWYQKQPAILADEMGLGKTIQVIAFFSILFHRHGVWPLLVVAPQSTVPNWKREFEKWAPDIRCVAYSGTKDYRQVQHEYMLSVGSGHKTDLSCHVIIVSYNAVMDGFQFFKQHKWQALVIDEGQHLKSDKNQIYKYLGELRVGHTMLLTGTPLQNNIRELFNLLQFLSPDNVNAGKMELEFSEMNEENVTKLHDLLRPYFLRRTKAEVLVGKLPEKIEIIVPVSMSSLQRRLYKTILAKNPDLLRSIVSKHHLSNVKASKSSLSNILMQLRKCLCHPYIYSQDIEETTDSQDESLKRLTAACGKLELLSLMLPKLIAGGHKILIFTQFLGMLDVLEDFLFYLNIKYVRIDGSVAVQDRQQRIDAFNAKNSDISVFMLSTRAGGVGINLATADTVIVYDPDYNPHQDLQALSRAHRLGQKNKVLVFNLVTRSSVEEKILEIGRKKMALDQIVIEKMKDSDDKDMDVQGILQTGARALFENNDDANSIKYDSASIDKLLDRSQATEDQSSSQPKEVNEFSFARVWENDTGELTEVADVTPSNGSSETEASGVDDGQEFWDKILKEREAEVEQERLKALTSFGRGKRREAVPKSLIDPLSVPMDGETPAEVAQQLHGKTKTGNRSRGGSADSNSSFREQDPIDDDDYRESPVRRVPGRASAQTNVAPGNGVPVASFPQVAGAPYTQMFSGNPLPWAAAGQPFTQYLPPQNSTYENNFMVPPSASASHFMNISRVLNGTPTPQSTGFAQFAEQPNALMASQMASTVPAAQEPRPILAVQETSFVPEPRSISTVQEALSVPAVQESRSILAGGENPSTLTVQEAPGGASTAVAQFDPLHALFGEILNGLPVSYNSRYSFKCDGSHKSHRPGECPIRHAKVETCPLCEYAHLPGAAVCVLFRSSTSLNYLLSAVSSSQEPEELKQLATRCIKSILENLQQVEVQGFSR